MGVKADLLSFLIALPAIDDPDERKAMVIATAYPNLISFLDWQGSNVKFCGHLLDVFGQREQSALVEFLQGMDHAPQVSDQRKLVLAGLRARVAALNAAGWQQEFATIATPATVTQSPTPVTTAVTQTIRTVESGATVIGYVGGSVTINKGATVDEIIEALGKTGLLSRVTTRLPEAQFRQLLDIVAQVTLADADDGFFRVYRAALPATARLVNTALPALLLTDLCEQPLIKAWPPLIEFIERLVLAAGIQAALASELQAWVDANAGLATPPTPAGEIERLRRAVRAEAEQAAGADATAWLQVYLEPDWLNRTQERKQPLFQVELVLWSPLTNGALVLQSEPVQQETGEAKRLWTLDELPGLLDQAFANRETVSLIPDMLQLIIEVVAPSDVLLYGFERWKRNGTANTYGAFHPLVVRLRDRLAIPNPADQKLADDFWHLKWNTFRSSVCHEKCEKLAWQAPEELDVFELQDDTDLACLGLSSPLALDRREVFDVLRDAGIPIALWLRGRDLMPIEPADLPERIKTLIQGKPLSDLYKKLQEVRRSKAARMDEKHIGNALTLLWDDPNRPPLKYEEQGVFV